MVMLPLDAVTQRNAFLGRVGSGKTYAATKLAELLYAAGAQVVAFDHVGVWWGLRLAKDGKKAGIPIPVFGGLHGDIPLTHTSGALIADLVVEKRLSVVLDVSQFESDRQKARFSEEFADRFYRRMTAAPSAVHVFLEECQEAIPENTQDGEKMMLHYWTRMAKLGRNFGIGLSLISQRPQEVNKKVLNLTELLFAFQMRGVQERKTVEQWLASKGEKADVKDVLQKLAVGECMMSSPQWLQFEGVVKIAPKWTYDSSSTPSFTHGAKERREPAPLDLGELEKAMAAAIEEADANDPRLLRKRIAELEKERDRFEKEAAALADRDGHADGAELAELERLGGAVESLQDQLRREGERADEVRERIATVQESLREATESLEAVRNSLATGPVTGAVLIHSPRRPISASDVSRASRTLPASRVLARAPRRLDVAETSPRRPNNGDLGGPHRKILNALAWLETIGVMQPSVEACAFVAGYRPGGGAYNNPRGALRTMGLVDYPSAGVVALTEAGRAAADPPEAPRSRAHLHALVLGKLTGPEQAILKPLLDAYPDAMEIAALAEASGYSQGGGAFNNPRGRLRTLGLIDYPRAGQAVACDILFPRGLR